MRTARLLLQRARFWAVVGAGVAAVCSTTPVTGQDKNPLHAVLVTPSGVSADKAAGWKAEGFTAVAVLLDDADDAAALHKAAKVVRDQALDLYYWVEVGRCPALARAHPEWMASLGMHDDWRKRFPNVRAQNKGEVAKAWPWVPIRYREAYDGQRQRIEGLLARVLPTYRGVLLNDLQGGPASCGCGNLQCRWATDYHVPSTATTLAGNDVAARFVADIGKSLPGKQVIPVWTTECEKEDLPLAKLPKGSWSTGYCGDVPCLETCRKRFHEQWAALQEGRRGPTALLLLHREFQRERREYAGPAKWMSAAVAATVQQANEPFPKQRLWLVVQGYDTPAAEEAQLRRAATALGAGAVLVARTRIDQSYEPRFVNVAPAR